MPVSQKNKTLSLALLTILASSSTFAEDATQLPPFNVSTKYNSFNQAIENQGVNSQYLSIDPDTHIEFESITNSVPGFHNSDSGASSFGNVYSFRGSANTPFFGPSALAVYIDGVPQLDSKSLPEELGVVSSIQFLKGGQASRIGQNANAGAILISTPNPDASLSRSRLSLEVGTDNLRGGSIITQNKIGDKGAAYTFYGYESRSDGFVSNPLDPNTRIGEKRHTGASLRIALPKFNEWESEVSFTWNQARDGEQAFTPLSNPAFVVSKDFDGVTNQDSKTTALKLSKVFDSSKLSWTSSYTDWEMGPYTTLMEIFPGFSLESDLGQSNKQWTHEIVYSSHEQTPLSWEIGGYYQSRDSGGQTTRSIPNVMTIEESEFSHDIEEAAIRFNTSYQINETVATGFGLRWEHNTQDLVRNAIVPAPVETRLSQSNDSLQGDYFISTQFAENLSVSLRAFAVEKAGGFSTYTGELAYMPFGRERSKGIELNGEWLNAEQNVGINVSIYSTTINGYQIERSFTESDYFVVNADEVKSQGGELLLWLHPTEKLNIQFSQAITDTVFESYIDPFGQTDFKGKKVPYVPQTSSNFKLSYQFNDSFSLSTDWSYKGRVHFDEGNTDLFTADSYIVGNLWLKYARDAYTIELGMKNATNKTYASFINAGVFQQVHGNPRQTVLRFGLEF